MFYEILHGFNSGHDIVMDPLLVIICGHYCGKPQLDVMHQSSTYQPSAILKYTKMKQVYGSALFMIIVLLLVWHLMVVHQIGLFESGPSKVSHRLPASWKNTSRGFTIDCCSGSPNTKHWPQQLDIISDDFTLESTLGTHEDAIKRQSSFVEIFQKRHWGDSKSDPEELSASGAGSTLAITALVRQTLDFVINDIKYALKKRVLRVLDIPCGDLRWMSVFLTNRTDIDYTGMDIVPDIIEHHKKTYSDQPWTFHIHDIVAEPLSTSFDLIFSRDMTQHLTNSDTLRVLQHFSSSGSHFAMLTTYPSAPHNERDVDLNNKGRCHKQDLERPPYSLTPPICVRHEKKDGGSEYSALWRLPMKQRPSG